MALNRGSNYTLEDIYEGLCSKKMQLWMWGDEGALVTTIQTKENVKFCLLLVIGGSQMTKWAHYFPIVKEWAKDQGCSEMRIYGRRGWSRLFPEFKVEYVKMVHIL